LHLNGCLSPLLLFINFLLIHDLVIVQDFLIDLFVFIPLLLPNLAVNLHLTLNS